MTQRIPPVKNPEGKAAELLDGVKAALGSTPNMFTTFANAAAALEAYLNFSGALKGGTLGAKLSEQIALTVAGYNGCNYCASAHSFLGDLAGLSKAELEDNLAGQSSDPKTQAALTFAENLVHNRGHIRESDLKAVQEAGYTDEQIIEILSHVALNILTNYFNVAFQVDNDFPAVETAMGRQLEYV